MSQHAGLTAERWHAFTIDQQVLMIANEVNRARSLLEPGDRERLQHCLERVLRLTDLTAQARVRPAFRRELLRWRGLMAAIYLAESPLMPALDEAFVTLLRFTPAAATQIAALRLESVR